MFVSNITYNRGWLARSALALIATLTILLAAGMVFAHATLISSDPTDGIIIDFAPETFQLHYNEPVSPVALTLFQPDGSDEVLEDFSTEGSNLIITAPDNLADGSYGLSWRVISEDGHPVGGTVLFSVGAPGGAVATSAGMVVDWPLRGAIWATKLLLYMGLFIGVGGVFFTRWVGGWTRQGDGLMGGVMLVGLVAAGLSFGLQGLDMLGHPLAGLLTGAPWTAALASSYARTVALAIIALLCALAALRGHAAKPLSGVAFIATGLALMASGHVSSAAPHFLTRPAIFTHALMIAFWIGALIPLVAVFTRHMPDAEAVLARFSRLIPWSVLLLVGAGIAMARVQLGGAEDAFTTTYGRVFLVKLGLLAVLFAVAGVNRFWLTAPVMRGEARAVARFRRSVMVELVLVLAIFGTVALWRFTPPPRAIAASEAMQTDSTPAILHVEAGGNLVMLHIEPGRAGPVAAEMYVYDMEADAIPAKEVTLILSNPDAGIEPIRRRVTAPDEYDAWHVDDLILPVPGDWQVRIEALISDFDMLKAEGIITIEP